MKSILFSLSLFCTNLCFASLNENNLLIAPESLWIKNQNIPLLNKPIELSATNKNTLNLEFRSPNSRTLLETDKISLQRKILLNADGTEFSTETFLWDLQLELNYKI